MKIKSCVCDYSPNEVIINKNCKFHGNKNIIEEKYKKFMHNVFGTPYPKYRTYSSAMICEICNVEVREKFNGEIYHNY